MPDNKDVAGLASRKLETPATLAGMPKYQSYQFPYEMKLRITITGPKVHDVGYRPWLTEQAMDAYLRGFEVYNDEVSGQQAVIALAEADEPRIKRFYNSVKTTQPQLAKVSGVTSEEHTGEIMPSWQAAIMGNCTLLNKAIPILSGAAKKTDIIPPTEKIQEGIEQSG